MSMFSVSIMNPILVNFIKFCLLVITCCIGQTHANEPIRLSQPISSDTTSETFGAPLDLSLPMVELKSLMQNAEQKLGEKHLIFTKIAKVCQKKGCFFIAQQDDMVVRVSFKDYGFFIPTDSSNKPVMMSGELVKVEVSQDKAEHYNADLGLANHIKPGEVFEIVVESIKIPL